MYAANLPKLHNIKHTVMATRRSGLSPLQRVRPVPQAPWSPTTNLPQDGCDQEPKSSQELGAASKEEGACTLPVLPAGSMFLTGLPSRLASSTRRTRTAPPAQARTPPRDRKPVLLHPATTTTTITARCRRSRRARGHHCPVCSTTHCCTTLAPTRRLHYPLYPH